MAFVVEVRGETSDLEKALDAAQRKLETLDETAARTGNSIAQGMKEAARAADEAQKAIDKGVTQALKDAEKAANEASKAAAEFEESLIRLGEKALHQVIEMSDEWTQVGNRIRSVGGDVDEVSQKLLAIADSTRTGIEETSAMYQRFSVSLQETGVSEDRVLALTKELNEIAVTSGRSSREASLAMFELSHAFSEGHLQGRQYKALWMEMPQVLLTVQHELGVSREKLDEMAKSGQLTGEVVMGALEDARGSIDAGFAKTAPTLSQQWTVAKNDLTAAVGQMVQESGALETVTQTFKDLSSAIRDVSSALHEVSSIKNSVTSVTDKLPTAPGWNGNPYSFQRQMNEYGEKLKDPFNMDTHFTQQEVQGLTGNAMPGSDEWWNRGTKMNDMLQSMSGYYEGLTNRANELGGALHSNEQQMLDFVRQAIASKDQTTLWGDALNLLDTPIIKLHGHLTSIGDVWDEIGLKAGKSVDKMKGISDLDETILPNLARALLGGQVRYDNSDPSDPWGNTTSPTINTWGLTDKEIHDKITKTKYRGGGPAVRDTNWVQSLMSDLGAYLGAGAGLAQGGLQQASGGGIDFWDASGTLDRLKQLHDLEAAHIQPGIHADQNGDLTLGGGLNGVITQVVQGMTELVHQGMQWAGVELWDPEKAKHTAEGLANLQRWNQELDGINSKSALAKKQEYEEFALRTGDVSGGISSAIHKFSDDSLNAAKVVEKAFTTAFDGIEKALINFVDTGKLELGDLAKQLEHLLLDLAFRQAVGAFGSLGGGSTSFGGASIAGSLGFGSLGDGGGDDGGLGGIGSAAARARAPQIHIHMDGGMVASALSQPAAQSAITNVVYRQHGNVLSVRDRLRSRG